MLPGDPLASSVTLLVSVIVPVPAFPVLPVALGEKEIVVSVAQDNTTVPPAGALVMAVCSVPSLAGQGPIPANTVGAVVPAANALPSTQRMSVNRNRHSLDRAGGGWGRRNVI